MTSLNRVEYDGNYEKKNSEVLIELPDPKILSNDCNIILNGHHNYGMNDEKETAVNGEENDPFLNHKPSHLKTSSKNFPLKESFTTSSLEEDSDADLEPESSTYLLRDEGGSELSPKGLKSKPKLPSFRSPNKKQASTDSHSHIQHRPLGHPQSTLPNAICHVAKRYWPCTPIIWGLLCTATVVISFCLALGIYLSTTSQCDPPRQWWQRTAIYEVFPASFQDTDSDGFGDMQGLIRRLDYIQSHGIKVVRLKSIFSALDYPFEYEHMIDFANIDPHLGHVEDFREFVRELHSRGMHLILDLNPSITSDQHTWAAHWLLHRRGQYEHFYINITEEEGEEPPLEPNPDYSEMIWTSPHRTFGNHLYLNWSNPLLQQEMKNVLELWISQGVDGFYFKHLENLQVNDRSHLTQIVRQWRQVLDHQSLGRKVFMISHEDVKYLELVMDPLDFTSIPSLVDLVDASINLKKPNTSELQISEKVNRIRKFWNQFPFSPTIVWHFGAVETMRLASRIGAERNMAGLFLLTVLPGSFSIFYGDEIGMKDSFDPVTRKAYRGGQLAPMQWTSESRSNFTSEENSPWIPLHPESVTNNVESMSEKLQLFKRLVDLKRGSHTFIPTVIRPSLHEVFYLFNTPQEKDQPEYRFFENPCGLVIVEILQNEGVFFGNFGTEILRLLDGCGDMENLKSFMTFETFEAILSTNRSFIDQIHWRDLVLKPGDATIGPITI